MSWSNENASRFAPLLAFCAPPAREANDRPANLQSLTPDTLYSSGINLSSEAERELVNNKEKNFAWEVKGRRLRSGPGPGPGPGPASAQDPGPGPGPGPASTSGSATTSDGLGDLCPPPVSAEVDAAVAATPRETPAGRATAVGGGARPASSAEAPGNGELLAWLEERRLERVASALQALDVCSVDELFLGVDRGLVTPNELVANGASMVAAMRLIDFASSSPA